MTLPRSFSSAGIVNSSRAVFDGAFNSRIRGCKPSICRKRCLCTWRESETDFPFRSAQIGRDGCAESNADIVLSGGNGDRRTEDVIHQSCGARRNHVYRHARGSTRSQVSPICTDRNVAIEVDADR